MIPNFVTLGQTAVSTGFLKDHQVFLSLLEDVFRQIENESPPDAKTICKYWNDRNNHWLLNSPLIALNDIAPDRGSQGATSYNGFMLRFDQRVIDHAIQHNEHHLVRDIIAHELGHVDEYASGDDKTRVHAGRNHCDLSDAEREEVRRWREKYANARMRAWRFKILPTTPPEDIP